MERNRDTLNALIEYLVVHGYPVSSIALEFPAGRRRADLAVVDPATTEIVAVFELKRERNPKSEMVGREQLRSYLEALGNPAIPSFLVFDRPGQTPPFEIERIKLQGESTDGGLAAALPNFDVLQKSRRSTAVAEKKTEKKVALDMFLVACWISAFVTGIFFIVDLLTNFHLTQHQLALLGATVALVLIPFASKLKILGVEFERLKKETEKD